MADLDGDDGKSQDQETGFNNVHDTAQDAPPKPKPIVIYREDFITRNTGGYSSTSPYAVLDVNETTVSHLLQWSIATEAPIYSLFFGKETKSTASNSNGFLEIILLVGGVTVCENLNR
mgnify:CR=1 FL=1